MFHEHYIMNTPKNDPPVEPTHTKRCHLYKGDLLQHFIHLEVRYTPHTDKMRMK